MIILLLRGGLVSVARLSLLTSYHIAGRAASNTWDKAEILSGLLVLLQ